MHQNRHLFIETILEKCRSKASAIGLPESDDPRVLNATVALLKNKAVSSVVLFGDEKKILEVASKNSIDLSSVHESVVWVQQRYADIEEQVADSYIKYLKSKHKVIDESLVQSYSRSFLAQSGYLLSNGDLDAVVAGCVYTTGEVIKSAIGTVGLAEGIKTVSGSFLLHRADDNRTCIFADSAVVIDPSIEQLVDIAASTVESWKSIQSEIPPKVAFLSFSTKGSARHPHVEKISKAALLFKEKYPDIIAEGELQFDAAIVPEIASRKCPDSNWDGRANCFIFPDLNSGNIAYKIAQRFAGFQAWGPFLQGVAKPFCDLSRGASAEEIYATALINLIRS